MGKPRDRTLRKSRDKPPNRLNRIYGKRGITPDRTSCFIDGLYGFTVRNRKKIVDRDKSQVYTGHVSKSTIHSP